MGDQRAVRQNSSALASSRVMLTTHPVTVMMLMLGLMIIIMIMMIIMIVML